MATYSGLLLTSFVFISLMALVASSGVDSCTKPTPRLIPVLGSRSTLHDMMVPNSCRHISSLQSEAAAVQCCSATRDPMQHDEGQEAPTRSITQTRIELAARQHRQEADLKKLSQLVIGLAVIQVLDVQIALSQLVLLLPLVLHHMYLAVFDIQVCELVNTCVSVFTAFEGADKDLLPNQLLAIDSVDCCLCRGLVLILDKTMPFAFTSRTNGDLGAQILPNWEKVSYKALLSTSEDKFCDKMGNLVRLG
ncbi:MAG: hypothetical protein FRX49_11449 [Trebouxia sp. A1-2]|nr:MAG: hypothetical protein FRX49_11449 [Trebouxia sp. A1-2]